MANIHWGRVGVRLQRAATSGSAAAVSDHIAAADVQAMLARQEGIVVLDVREDDDLAAWHAMGLPTIPKS